MIKYIYYWEEEEAPEIEEGQVLVPLNKEYFALVNVINDLTKEINLLRRPK